MLRIRKDVSDNSQEEHAYVEGDTGEEDMNYFIIDDES